MELDLELFWGVRNLVEFEYLIGVRPFCWSSTISLSFGFVFGLLLFLWASVVLSGFV